jgi:hypothetical protein
MPNKLIGALLPIQLCTSNISLCVEQVAQTAFHIKHFIVARQTG